MVRKPEKDHRENPQRKGKIRICIVETKDRMDTVTFSHLCKRGVDCQCKRHCVFPKYMPKRGLQEASCPLKCTLHFKGAGQALENTCHWEMPALERDTVVQDQEVGGSMPG